MDKLPEQLSLEEAWKLAIQREREAQELYRALAERVSSSEARALFSFLLEQEKEHEQRLQDEYDRAFAQEW
ncbi:MAG: ferritin family protein [Chloroflexia bacterium]